MPESLTPAQSRTYIDNSRHFTREVLLLDEVQKRLGQHANELFALTNSMTPVDVENGTVNLDSIPLHKVPVAVLRVGEQVLRSSSHTFDAFQRQTIQRTFEPAESQTIEEEYRRQWGHSRPLHVFDKELAYVTESNILDSGFTVRARPLLVLNHDRSSRPWAPAPVVLHELTHMRQWRELPILDPDYIDPIRRNISDELEAYSVAAQTILGIQDANQQHNYLTSIPEESIEKALAIEDIRQTMNRYETDPYAATNKISAELVNKGYGITPFLKGRIKKKSDS